MANVALRSPFPLERLTGARVKGTVIRAHLGWVREHASREETIELFEALPAELRQQAATFLPEWWYDLAALIAIDRVILTLFGQGDVRFLEQVGAHTARAVIPTSSNGLPPDTMHDFFRLIVRRRYQQQDFCRAEYAEITPSASSSIATPRRSVHSIVPHPPGFIARSPRFTERWPRKCGSSSASAGGHTNACFP